MKKTGYGRLSAIEAEREPAVPIEKKEAFYGFSYDTG